MEPINPFDLYDIEEELPKVAPIISRLVDEINQRLKELDKRLSSAEQNVSDHEQELGKERNIPVEPPKPPLMLGDKIVYPNGDQFIINEMLSSRSKYVEVWRKVEVPLTVIG